MISNHTIRERRPDSVGRPLPNVEVRISEDGEILARGDNISPGYWNAPEQTAATFQTGGTGPAIWVTSTTRAFCTSAAV